MVVALDHCGKKIVLVSVQLLALKNNDRMTQARIYNFARLFTNNKN